MVCSKLGLQPGERLLDIGCGWGSFATHAAARHGVEVTGITLSEPQAGWPVNEPRTRESATASRSGSWTTATSPARPFDAIASIGMVEHVGAENIDLYARRLLRPAASGGRLLNHGIARLRHTDPEAGPFSERYVFPDADPLHLSRVELALERAGFVTEHVEGFASDYAETLRHWARRLDENIDEARAWPDRSACASGGSTFVRPATASRAASPRSTRSGRAGHDRLPAPARYLGLVLRFR